jgi:hypothetical protein
MVAMIEAHFEAQVPVFIVVLAGKEFQVEAEAVKIVGVQRAVVKAPHIDKFDAVLIKDVLDLLDLIFVLFFALLLPVGLVGRSWFGYSFITAAIVEGGAANIVTELAVAAAGAERAAAFAATFWIGCYLMLNHPLVMCETFIID